MRHKTLLGLSDAAALTAAALALLLGPGRSTGASASAADHRQKG